MRESKTLRHNRRLVEGTAVWFGSRSRYPTVCSCGCHLLEIFTSAKSAWRNATSKREVETRPVLTRMPTGLRVTQSRRRRQEVVGV